MSYKILKYNTTYSQGITERYRAHNTIQEQAENLVKKGYIPCGVININNDVYMHFWKPRKEHNNETQSNE